MEQRYSYDNNELCPECGRKQKTELVLNSQGDTMVLCSYCRHQFWWKPPAHMIPKANFDDVIMPFGKYRGRKLKDIPRDYLAWVHDNLDLKPGQLTEALKALCGGVSKDEGL